MVYLEQQPAAPLRSCVRTLWYARAPQVAHQRERILPNGSVQVIFNLARDFILDIRESAEQRVAPALVVGARATYEIVDTSDMADLIGIAFEPGGFAAFVSDPVDAFTQRSISLDDAWGSWSRELRPRLQEAPSPAERLALLESLLLAMFRDRLARDPRVDFALNRFALRADMSTVREVACETGWSERRFSQVFREQVGLTPKVWCRLRRFQRALHQLHSGVEVRWAEIALDCGYYDQSHFANEFRAFSGVDATAYSAHRTQWVNHIAVD
jgi:AraC-like DNA-binding protein